jgi:type II secretory pathway pseudopilin PulG
MKLKHMTSNKKGFTIVEVIVATGIFLLSISGIIYSFLKCMELQDIGQSVSIATQAVNSKMEDIKSSTFANMFTTYNNTTFTANNINGRGVVYVDNTLPDLIQIKVVFCWRQKTGQLFGEDTNLNGVLNVGEDKNANGQLDSYVQIITNIYG